MEANVDAAEMVFCEGREAEVTSDEEGYKGAWYTVTILKLQNQNNTQGNALVQYKNLLEDDNETPFTENFPLSNIRPLPPQPEVPGDQLFEVKDVVDGFYLDGWWPGSVSKVLDNPKRYIVTFDDPEEDVEFSSSELRPHWEWVDGKWVNSSKLQVSCNTTRKDAGTTVQLQRSDALKRSTRKLEPCSSRKSEMGLSIASEEPGNSEHLKKRPTTEGDATPLHPSKKSKNGRSEKSLVPGSNVKKTNLQKENDVSIYKKDGAKTGVNRIEQPNVVLKIKQPILVPTNCQSTSADDAADVLEETFSEEQIATKVESSAISRLEQAEGIAVVSTTDCQRKITNMAVEPGRVLHETEEDSPLICYKELQPDVRKIHSAVTEENNPGHIPHGFANQGNDPREKSLETVVQSPLALVGMAGDIEPQELQDLPFVKSLPMWQTIESMEIFQVMQQNPHFHPLIELKEILREGIAVGHMLNFASMVQRISKLTAADPRNHFTSILDALPDFEILGFDVKAIRGRMSELLLMKDKRDRLQYNSEEVKLQVKQHCDKITKLKEEIAENYKKIRELEEKQALLLSKEESETSEFTLLQLSSDVTTQDIQRVENDIDCLVGSPW